MKIIEVRDGFIKFEKDENIFLSSFIKIDGMDKSYIAQVQNIKSMGNVNIATAKILFLYDGEKLLNYDKTEPSRDAEIQVFTSEILNSSINAAYPVIIGKTLNDADSIKIDASAFNKKMIMSLDNKNTHNILVRNLTKQFNNLDKNTIVIDTLGIIDAKKYRPGIDFKLPLNRKTLAFMYESCLNDATADSKSTIVEIFRDLAEYSESVPFVPFAALKSIVDEMVDKQHIFKLLVLKNKLAKFEKLGYFATNYNDVINLDKILSSKCAVIDLSNMDILFQNRYLSYIYEKLQNINNIQVIFEIANTISKHNMKNIIKESEASTVLMTHSKFQYLNDIKNLFDNFIIEPTISNNRIFNIYSSFLTSMNENTYLVVGESTNYIPLVSETKIIDEVIPYTKPEVRDDKEEESENTLEAGESEYEDENISDEIVTPDDNMESETEDNISDINIDINEESDEDDVHLTQEEVLAVIEEKSNNVITAVSENLSEPETIELFSDNDSSNEEEASEEMEESEGDIITDDDSENIIADSELMTDDSKISDNKNLILEELNNEQEENSENSISEINGTSENIDSIDDEEMVIQELTDNSESVPNADEISLDNLSADDLISDMTEDDLVDSDTNESLISLDENYDEDIVLEDTEETSIEIDNDVEFLLEDDSSEEEEEEESSEKIELTEEDSDSIRDVDFSEPQIMPIDNDIMNSDFDEIVELDPDETDEADIVVDLADNQEPLVINEDTEQQIIEDVDKVYTTMKNESESEEEISDTDLDLIDELNNEETELDEYSENIEELSDYSSDEEILEEVSDEQQSLNHVQENNEILEKRDSNTPIVPVYDADIPQEDMVISDPIQQGDAVNHAKYGNGVVEKMIKYGNKTLFAINFENIGRRLLDPTLTEIKKV